MADKKNTYRYNLALPMDLWEAVNKAADDNGTTVVEIIRKCLRVGLLALETQQKPETALIIREDGKERQLLIY